MGLSMAKLDLVEWMILFATIAILVMALRPGISRWMNEQEPQSVEQHECEDRGGWWEVEYMDDRKIRGYRCSTKG